MLRFELELALLEEAIEVADLPAAWNERMRDYLGVEVPDDAHGVLQDVHWAEGLFGYFPTYALGNVIGGQIWARAQAELPDVASAWPPATSRRCAPGWPTTSTATAAGCSRPSCSSAWSAARSTPPRCSPTSATSSTHQPR